MSDKIRYQKRPISAVPDGVKFFYEKAQYLNTDSRPQYKKP